MRRLLQIAAVHNKLHINFDYPELLSWQKVM